MITTELTNEQYHATPGFSSSVLKTFISQSPKAAWERYIRPDRPKEHPSKAMLLGTMVHTLVLEPENFEKDFPAGGELPLTNTGRMREKTFHETISKAKAVADAVKRHPMARGVLYPSGAIYESSFFEDCPKTGLKLKCRPDALLPENWAVDLKTTSTGLTTGFPYQARSLGYHLQEAFYRYVLECCGATVSRFFFVVVETVPPHDVVVYELNSSILSEASVRVADALEQIATLQKSEAEWPGIAPSDILPLRW